MPTKPERERIAIELKKWLRSQDKYRTISELEHPTGIPYSSLKDYFQGRALPSGARLEKLAALTNIPNLASLPARTSSVPPTERGFRPGDGAIGLCDGSPAAQ
jgi:hypothetical protein